MTLGLSEDPVASETWRDPLVFRDPDGDGLHMFITARLKGAARLDDGVIDGVIGHARSADMVHWEPGPPLSRPAGFGQIEVPQARTVGGRPTLVFTCHTDEQADRRKAQSGLYCAWSVPGNSLVGPWDVSRARPVVAEPDLFAAPFVQDRLGNWVLVGFVNLEPRGIKSFDIIDPIPVTLQDGIVFAQPGYTSVGEALLAAKSYAPTNV